MPTIDMDAAPSGAGLPSLSGDLSAGEHLEVPLDQLVLGENVRTDVVLTDEFVDDIREHGVEVEILARRDVVGQLVVLDGQTRCLAAAKAGLKTVPVKVVDGVGDDEERIARQYRLNEHRTPLTAAQKVAAAERLALFGRTPKAIARKLHVPEADVTAALAVAQSKAAKKQLAEPEVDLAAAAILAEFDDDPAAVKRLTAELQSRGRGALDQAAARERLDRARAAAVENRRAALTAAGVTILDQGPDTFSRGAKAERLWNLSKTAPKDNGRTPKEISAVDHESCPGHAVRVRAVTAFGSTDVKLDEEFFCLDWRANGHFNRYSVPKSPAGATDEEAKEAERAERRRVRENNTASDAAVLVRRAFITDLLKQKPPAGALEHAAILIHRYDRFVADHGTQTVRAEIWPAPRPVEKHTPSSPEALRSLLALALALGEAGLPRDFWRSKHTEWTGGNGCDNTARGVLHLRALAAWGYTLADVEQAWLDDADGGAK